MSNKQFWLATLGYTVTTFALAVLWHLGLFTEVYEQIGYIGRAEPGFLLGLLSIIIQGGVLAYLYPKFSNDKCLIIAMFAFHWSMHVAAAAAKNQINNVQLYFGIETVYLIIQFFLAAVILRLVYKR